MPINAIPTEVLDAIFSHLNDDLEGREYSLDYDYVRELCRARLVCRRWSNIARPRLFQTVTLKHRNVNAFNWNSGFTSTWTLKASGEGIDEEPTGQNLGKFSNWQCMLDNKAIRADARHALIYSTPDNLYNDRDWFDWALWEKQGMYREFTDAIDLIGQLSNLRAVTLYFARKCRGVENGNSSDDRVEKSSTRQHTLRAVLGAIQDQANNGANASVVRSLTIRNLQNMPLPGITSSLLFKAATKNITDLHLGIVQEYSWVHNVEVDIQRVERREFEPYLHAQWLAPLADQLTSLTLYLDPLPWGLMPAYFSGQGLNFPHLRELSLGNFAIGHDDHFDWVLRQKSLRRLWLDRCSVASLIHLNTDLLERWNVRTDDWVKIPADTFGFDQPSDVLYRYLGTWETLFDRIRCELPHLIDFKFSSQYRARLRFRRPLNAYTDASSITCRYVVIDCAHMRLFRPIDDENGNVVLDIEGRWYQPHHQVNRAEETLQGDERALKALLEAVSSQAR